MEQLDLFGAAQENIEKSLLADLLEQSRLYRHSKDYLELLDFVTRLPNFAPFNAFLLRLQKPGLRFASSAYDWRRKFNRRIKEGARPLIILWPFGPIALVYEVDDTEGDPLPESVLNAFHATGAITEAKINRFSLLLSKVGIDLKLIEYGDAHAGHFIGHNGRPHIPPIANLQPRQTTLIVARWRSTQSKRVVARCPH